MKDEGVSAATIWSAAQEIATGNFEADLGGLLFKKRIPRQSEGKRSGYRVLVGFRKQGCSRVVFLYAFGKNQRTNITANEKKALQLVAKAFMDCTDKQLEELLANNDYSEVLNDE